MIVFHTKSIEAAAIMEFVLGPVTVKVRYLYKYPVYSVVVDTANDSSRIRVLSCTQLWRHSVERSLVRATGSGNPRYPKGRLDLPLTMHIVHM